MYNFVRIIIAIITFLIIVGILKKTRKWNNTTQTIVVVFGVVFYIIISKIRIENMFMTFSSPEKVLNYYMQGEYVDAIEGNESCMVLYTTRSSGGMMFIHKKDKGYKLPSLNTNSLVNVSGINGGGTVYTYNVNGTNDYYIYAIGYNDNDIEKVSLDSGKEITLHKDDIGDKIYFYTYAYIEDYNSRSYIMVDSQKIGI